MKDEKKQIQHVAIIMDGNRRWAKKRHLPSFVGHQKGEERIKPIIDEAIRLKIAHLTFWAFSTENWHRSKSEVNFLLNLYRSVLHKKIDGFHKKNVRINIIGNLLMFPKDVQEMTLGWKEKTKNNNKITVNFALSYGGRDEIIRAIKKMGQSTKQWNNVTIEQFSNFLDTAGQPDPDLLIRTGGEKRLSGFLLWQLEYAELYFTDDFWPDFTPIKFRLAVEEYYSRQRRFGK